MQIRALGPEDWEAFRDLRLIALKTDPTHFGSTYEREVEFDEETWRDRVSRQGKEMFGLYDGERMIGLTGIITDPELDEGHTAILVASFLLPEYRGRGLSAMLFEARFAWARAQQHITKILTYVRTSNTPSKRAIEGHGFTEINRFDRTWPDGTGGEQIDYELIV